MKILFLLFGACRISYWLYVLFKIRISYGVVDLGFFQRLLNKCFSFPSEIPIKNNTHLGGLSGNQAMQHAPSLYQKQQKVEK